MENWLCERIFDRNNEGQVFAVDNLMKDLGQDLSKIERKSEGFLEVW